MAGIASAFELEDRYTLESGRVYLTGSQALVRLPIMQRQRDLRAGLNTAGFISGYTGSPLGGYDLALKKASAHIDAHHIRFLPGLNEELAATSVSGSQQSGLMPGARYDGVFAIWYGKGPGLDRAGDAIKHGSFAGAAKHGGVLVLAGDDHGAKSSTTAHQSDHAFVHFGMPYLNPSSVQDYLDFGLHGFALSRYSGCWVGMKCVTDTVESSASVSIDPDRVQVRLPGEPGAGVPNLEARWGVLPMAQEARQFQQRLPAAQDYVRANGLDRIVRDSSRRRLGLVTSGKAYLDVMQALDDLGLDEARCEELGVSVYKIAMPWPLEPAGMRAFSREQSELLVVEEKRPVIEPQLAALFYNEASRPRLIGKFDERGVPLIGSEGELAAGPLALVIGKRLLALRSDDALAGRLALLEQSLATTLPAAGNLRRMPAFCAGCPHNTSTKVPDGSVALGGIGCHGMALFLPERRTLAMSQMGGEGAAWIGMAPFNDTPHIFQNLGDGTYFHSGLLAIRAAIAAGVNITYKILVNDAVAMTGGQAIEGQVRVDDLTKQVHAEGVRRIAVLTDDPRKYDSGADFAPGVTLHHRDELDRVQKELRTHAGVSVIVYDQTCATELRRRRKRGKAVDPDRRVFINEAVCEGCGDCGVQSNCIAIEPVETPLGRKRQIDQSACNKDQSCLKGYCPSFVTLRGAVPRKRGTSVASDARAGLSARLAALKDPPIAATSVPFSILIAGIGGSGVVTMGALLGTAAHLEGKASSVLDVAGLAQRNGPVTSHVRVADQQDALHATRIAWAGADLVVGCDIVVASGQDVLSRVKPGHTHLIVNSHVSPTSAFASDPNLDLSAATMIEAITAVGGEARASFVDASELAYALMGNAVAANLFLLGHAAQSGLLPISVRSLERAIELNGVQVDENKASLAWGRLAVTDRGYVEGIAAGHEERATVAAPMTLAQIVEDRAAKLVQYQGASHAARYRELVERVSRAESAIGDAHDALAMAVARYYYKLLAYKDEYEVARLQTDPAFRQRLAEEFEGDLRLSFHFAPPLFQRRDPETGRYPKREFGAWMAPLLKGLARLKFLRGTVFDPFGYAAHRRQERQLIVDFERDLARVMGGLTPQNHGIAVEIASLPESIRGYDTVKDASIGRATESRARLFERFDAAGNPAANLERVA